MKSILANRFKMTIIASMLALVGLLAAPIATAAVEAQSPQQVVADLQGEACDALGAIGGDCGGGDDEVNSTIQNVVNILLYVVGVASVIMLIYGAIRFVVSAGDPQGVASARNTIVYSLIGVVVAFMAYALVDWVINRVDSGAAGGGAGQEVDLGEDGNIPEGGSNPNPGGGGGDAGTTPPGGNIPQGIQ